MGRFHIVPDSSPLIFHQYVKQNSALCVNEKNNKLEYLLNCGLGAAAAVVYEFGSKRCGCIILVNYSCRFIVKLWHTQLCVEKWKRGGFWPLHCKYIYMDGSERWCGLWSQNPKAFPALEISMCNCGTVPQHAYIYILKLFLFYIMANYLYTVYSFLLWCHSVSRDIQGASERP